MTTEELKRDIERGREALHTLTDEVRVRLHLATMDARDAWADLSREAEKVSHRIAQETSEAAHTALDDLLRRVREFSTRLAEKEKEGHRPPVL